MLDRYLFVLDVFLPLGLIGYGLVVGWRCVRVLLFARRRLRDLDETDFIE